MTTIVDSLHLTPSAGAIYTSSATLEQSVLDLCASFRSHPVLASACCLRSPKLTTSYSMLPTVEERWPEVSSVARSSPRP